MSITPSLGVRASESILFVAITVGLVEYLVADIHRIYIRVLSHIALSNIHSAQRHNGSRLRNLVDSEESEDDLPGAADTIALVQLRASSRVCASFDFVRVCHRVDHASPTHS